jgi:hydrogenase 3 maturation protease
MDTIIMCIGNRDGGDDAIGPYIADQLNKIQLKDMLILDCGVAPENYTSVVKRHTPQQVIIVDATDMHLEPGEIRIVPKEKIGLMHISTHGIPLSVLIGYLEQYIANIVFIGIQPETMSGEMAKSVRESGKILIERIKNREMKQIKIL